MAELGRIELMIRSKLRNMRRDNGNSTNNTLQGLYISDKEIDSIVNTVSYMKEEETPLSLDPDPHQPVDTLNQLKTDISVKEKESLCRGIALRLCTLQQLFQLSEFDIEVLLVCLLPEINLKYQQVFAYLQDDVTQKSPTVNLVLELLCKSLPEMLEHRDAFLPGASLTKNQIINLYEDRYLKSTPLLSKSLQIDERIISYLLEIPQVDSRLLPFTQLLIPRLSLEDIVLAEDTRQFFNTLVKQCEQAPVCHLYGDNGTGKKATAEAVCSKLDIPILDVDLNRVLIKEGQLDTVIPIVFREGLLHNAALYLDNFDTLLPGEESNTNIGNILLAGLLKYPQWIFVASNQEWRPKETWQDRPFVSVEFPVPSYTLRKQLWEKYWDENTIMENDVDFGDFASKFRLTGGQIHNITINARNLARLRESEHQILTGQDISSLCRNESREILNNMARKIQQNYRWEDIILPPDLYEQLHEIYGCVQQSYRVYSDWGFDKKLSLGKGLHVLFSGPSGTGKTMAAGILAHELQLDLYKIDLSQVVSKYIGETEKNLDRIFKEGQTSNSILFFDEADAIFGKRSEVKDAHDRYANIEIAYLLQKMDEYEGMVILATNLRKNIDEAFSRRMHFALEFPIPEEPDRNRIWNTIFPPEAPLDKDVDFAFTARQFRVTGGNIKNIALGAAFLAAQNGNIINMKNIIRATKREYQKMGKLCTEDEFAEYIDLVK
ncbi:MAG: AAA family ATPase [Dehalococcoidales bacterium]|nr:AAA family ATPase [Dehalococcoidales bacterium]